VSRTDAPPRPHAAWQLAVLAAVGVALFAGFISLGVWQVQRRAWKLDLIERVSQRLTAAPTPLPPVAQWPTLAKTDIEYRHVQVQGMWLADKTVLTQATTALGQGFWVLTPLQLADGNTLLVNRGFIPSDQRSQWQPPGAVPSPAGVVAVHGLLRVSEPDGGFLRRNDPAAHKWYSRDVAAIAAVQKLPHIAPFFVDAGLPDARLQANPDALSTATDVWPREGLTVVHFSNSHLVYALTWFGLALMVVGAGGLVVRHERRLRAAGNNTAHATPD